MQAEAVSEWLSLGTSTIHEASRLSCASTSDFRPAWRAAGLCGPAFTVKCEPGDNLTIHRALEAAPSGSVLAVDGGGVMVDYWGEVLSRVAQNRWITRLLFGGGVRDVVEPTLSAARSHQRQEEMYMERIDAGELTVDIFGWRHVAGPASADRPLRGPRERTPRTSCQSS